MDASSLAGPAGSVTQFFDQLRADDGAIPSVRFSPDGTHAVTGGAAAKVWKLTR